VAFEQKSLDDYIEVSQRIADFREKYPEGTLQPANVEKPWELAIVTGNDKDGKPVTQSFVVYVAAAYRSPDDRRPGIGVAWEVFPGRTPYTRGSEIQNAETSAWGRAVIAVGASDSKRGIASREEVRNRQAEREDGLPVNKDGSLSRSRTSDEEKTAAGVMTDAQNREHNALAKPPAGKRSERLATTPEDDPWLDTNLSGSVTSPPPASAGGGGGSGSSGGSGTTRGEAAPGIPAEDLPGTASAGQLREMHGLFRQLGIGDRGKRLQVTRETLGLDMLASSTQLSYRQVGDLLLALRAQAKAEASR
jgi:hypothetical protein